MLRGPAPQTFRASPPGLQPINTADSTHLSAAGNAHSALCSDQSLDTAEQELIQLRRKLFTEEPAWAGKPIADSPSAIEPIGDLVIGRPDPSASGSPR